MRIEYVKLWLGKSELRKLFFLTTVCSVAATLVVMCGGRVIVPLHFFGAKDAK